MDRYLRTARVSADQAAQIKVLNNQAALPRNLGALDRVTSGLVLVVSLVPPGFGRRLQFPPDRPMLLQTTAGLAA